ADAVRAVAERAGAATRQRRRRDADAGGAQGADAGGPARRGARSRGGAAARPPASQPLVRPPPGMSAGSTPISVSDYEELAEKRLEAGAHGYFAGGAGDEATLRDNVAAWSRWILRPRLLVDVEVCTTTTTVLGQEVSMP